MIETKSFRFIRKKSEVLYFLDLMHPRNTFNQYWFISNIHFCLFFMVKLYKINPKVKNKTMGLVWAPLLSFQTLQNWSMNSIVIGYGIWRMFWFHQVYICMEFHTFLDSQTQNKNSKVMGLYSHNCKTLNLTKAINLMICSKSKVYIFLRQCHFWRRLEI